MHLALDRGRGRRARGRSGASSLGRPCVRSAPCASTRRHAAESWLAGLEMGDQLATEGPDLRRRESRAPAPAQSSSNGGLARQAGDRAPARPRDAASLAARRGDDDAGAAIEGDERRRARARSPRPRTPRHAKIPRSTSGATRRHEIARPMRFRTRPEHDEIGAERLRNRPTRACSASSARARSPRGSARPSQRQHQAGGRPARRASKNALVVASRHG